MLALQLNLLLNAFLAAGALTTDRLAVVNIFNPTRNHTNHITPLQVGNGNFAFGVDVTGLQTLRSFNTLSEWGWRSSTTKILKWRTEDWARTLTRRKQVMRAIEVLDCAWLHTRGWLRGAGIKAGQEIVAPKKSSEEESKLRINLGRIGLMWDGREIEQWEVNQPIQTLNMTTGLVTSNFFLYDNAVEVETVASPIYDALSISVHSDGFNHGHLALFLDFPYTEPDTEPPYVGNWRAAERHHTTARVWGNRAEIRHDIDDLTYYTNLYWTTDNSVSNFTRKSPYGHRYVVSALDTTTVALSVRFSQNTGVMVQSLEDVKSQSKYFWNQYWNSGAFIDCGRTKDPRAHELQRRVILSQYLMAVNCAGINPPLEAGLVSSSLLSRSRMEMIWWHLSHWQRWSKWERIGSVIPLVYQRLLNSSIDQARAKGFNGAFWGGKDNRPVAPGQYESTEASIWQQVHPFYFAEQEYLAFPNNRTLEKWHHILEESTDFMVSFAKWNTGTNVYDLGPPLDTVGYGNRPQETRNPTLELAYWRFGLRVAIKWYERQRRSVPQKLQHTFDHLAPYAVEHDSYISYEGAQPASPDSDLGAIHPAVVGIFGMLPSDDRLNMTLFRNTVANVYQTWNTSAYSGWEVPLLAMTAARMGDADRAVDLLLSGGFRFDDAGLPVGNARLPSPRFPSSGGLLMVVAMLASGWSEIQGKHWPRDWSCAAEGFAPGI
jgi:hypothetical protein